MRIGIILIFLGFCICRDIEANTINVPSQYHTIQEGINAASVGDTVLVEPGTYVENISFLGKNIVVASLYLTTADTSYISQTIIDGNQIGSVVTFGSMEDSTALLSGFTITNGRNEEFGGGGIFCIFYSSPRLENLNIVGNIGAGGGGILCFGFANPKLYNVKIHKNTAVLFGGGLHCEYLCKPTLENIIISDNISFQDGGGLYFLDTCNAKLSNVVIQDNRADMSGGGVGCAKSSNLSLNGVVLHENTAALWGGGFYNIQSSPNIVNTSIRNNTANLGGGLFSGSSLSPNLVNVTIAGNRAYTSGGGISLLESEINLQDVTIRDNIANRVGGGIHCDASNPIFDRRNRSNIYLNFAGYLGNDLHTVNSQLITIIVDTFTVNDQPSEYQVFPFENFAFNILNGKVNKTASDLYVSADGSNNNSGLSFSEPLKTISYALTKAISDTLNPLTIYLDSGNYSSSSNEENFPLNMKDFITVCGDTDSVSVLDAEGQSSVLVFNEDQGISIKNLTLTGGSADYGGGVFCRKSNPYLERVTIHGNSAEAGGGIYSIENSKPFLSNSTITGNTVNNGGALFTWNSHPTLVNTILWNNFPQEIYMEELNDTSSITIAYSDIQGGQDNIGSGVNNQIYWLDGNIDEDPLFVDVNLNDFSLQTSSLCINSGIQNSTLVYDNGNKALHIPIIKFEGSAPDIGAWEYMEPDAIADGLTIPMNFALYQNYPNPFNPRTKIKFSLPKSDKVIIDIYNALGQKVESLLNEQMPAGFHGVDFDGSNYASGLYFYRIKTSTHNMVKKMILVK